VSYCPNANCATVTELADGAVAIGSTRTPGVTVALTADEWAEFRAGIVREFLAAPPSPETGQQESARLLSAVAPYRAHHETVQAAVDFMRHEDDPGGELAHRLAATWNSHREDDPPEVLVLPAEPEVGRTVEGRGWLYVQDQGDGVVSFVGSSRVTGGEHPFRFGSGRTHQLVVGPVRLAPDCVVATDTLRGLGLSGLAQHDHDVPAMLTDGEVIVPAGPSGVRLLPADPTDGEAQ
jgi:hypothetical protein